MVRLTQTSVRSGFTLVEMLVVMGLMLALAALAAGVGYSGMIGSQRTVSSADRVSGWLILAKQRALRDGRPSGVRFILPQPGGAAPGTPLYFTEAQYVEVPEPWVPSERARVVVRSVPGTPAVFEVYFASTDPVDMIELGQRVKAGDRLVLRGLLEASYLLDDPLPPGTPNPGPITASPFAGDPELTPYQFSRVVLTAEATTEFAERIAAAHAPTNANSAIVLQTGVAFQGRAQPVLGEPLLQLTEPMMIDVRAGQTNPALSANSTSIGVEPAVDAAGFVSFDVLFKPSGQLLGRGNGDLVCLWIRNQDTLRDATGDANSNPRQNYQLAGEQLLVVISKQTGLISTQPVNDDANNPYLFARDGKNNGV